MIRLQTLNYIWSDVSFSSNVYMGIVRDFFLALMCLIIVINIFLENNEKVGAQIPFYVLATHRVIFVCAICIESVITIGEGEGKQILMDVARFSIIMASLFFYIANIVHIAGRRHERLRKKEKREMSSEEMLISIKSQYEKGILIGKR